MSPRREALTWEYVLAWCTANMVGDESKICDDHGRWLVAVRRDGMALVLEFSFSETRQPVTLSRLKQIATELDAHPDARMLVEDEQGYFRIVDIAEGYNEDGVQDTLRLQRRYR